MIVLSFGFSAIGPFSNFSLVGSSLWSSVKWPSLDFLVIVFSLSFSVIGYFFHYSEIASSLWWTVKRRLSMDIITDKHKEDRISLRNIKKSQSVRKLKRTLSLRAL